MDPAATDAGGPSPWARGLGYGGLIPFVALAAAHGLADHRSLATTALLGYGATIASFLGAIHWGLVMRDGQARSAPLLLWGVLPSLIALIALLLCQAAGLLVIGALLWACWTVDRVVYPSRGLQAWLPMRLRLTGVASLSCAAAAAVSLLGRGG